MVMARGFTDCVKRVVFLVKITEFKIVTVTYNFLKAEFFFQRVADAMPAKPEGDPLKKNLALSDY
jgi:hypothetical protein